MHAVLMDLGSGGGDIEQWSSDQCISGTKNAMTLCSLLPHSAALKACLNFSELRAHST